MVTRTLLYFIAQKKDLVSSSTGAGVSVHSTDLQLSRVWSS